MAYDNTNKGTFSKNKYKEKDNQPDLTGKINIEGRDYKLSAWKRENDNGIYYSCAFTPADEVRETPQKQVKAIDSADIPF